METRSYEIQGPGREADTTHILGTSDILQDLLHNEFDFAFRHCALPGRGEQTFLIDPATQHDFPGAFSACVGDWVDGEGGLRAES